MTAVELEFSTARLSAGGHPIGTGFFVAADLVATCAHVVGDRTSVDVWLGPDKYVGTVVAHEADDAIEGTLFPDVALIRVPARTAAFVALDDSCLPGDRLYSWGFSRLAPNGESIEGECEGYRDFGTLRSQRLVKFKLTQIVEGLSGAPVLNLRTGAVCGMIKRTRDDTYPAGGFAIRSAALLRHDPISKAQRLRDSPLRSQLRAYLLDTAAEAARLPPYYPQRVRSSFTVNQRVRVASQAQNSLEADRVAVSALPSDVYDPPHSRPERFSRASRNLFDRSVDRWMIGRLGAVDWDQLRADHRYNRLVVLGDPGYGKTWLLRREAGLRARACLTALEAGTEGPVVPLFARLQDLAQYSDRTERFEQTIEKALDGSGVQPELRRYLVSQVASGSAAVYLDAWDEVDAERRVALRGQIQTWIRRYRGPAILTSRFSRFGRFDFGDAPRIELLAFEQAEIQLFARMWFGQHRADAFLSGLRRHEGLSGLARIPLMLALLCRAFDEPGGRLPLSARDLCERCLKGLLSDWARGDEHEEPDALDVAYKLRTLGRVAYEHFPRSQWSADEFVAPLATRHDEAREMIDSFLRDGVLVRTGISSHSSVAFLHRTFHEFLTARHWASLPWSDARLDGHASDATWAQVIVFLAGDTTLHDAVVQRLADPDLDDEYGSRLALAIRCVAESSAVSRRLAIGDGLATRAIDIWLAHASLGTQGKLVGIEKALSLLPSLGCRYRGTPLATFLAETGEDDFLHLCSVLGPGVLTDDAVKRLTGLMAQASDAVRSRAIAVASGLSAHLPASEVIPVFLSESESSDFARAEHGLTALANMREGAAVPVVLDFFVNRVRNRDIPANWLASEVVAAMGGAAATPDILAQLLTAVRDRKTSATARQYAAGLLGELAGRSADERVVEGLLESVRLDRSPIRQLSARLLVSLQASSPDERVLLSLATILTEKDSGSSATAGWVLGHIGPKALTHDVLQAISSLFQSASDDDRGLAAYVVGQFGRPALRTEFVERLIDLTESGGWLARWKAAEALGQLQAGGDRSELLARLVTWIRDGDWVYRWKAAEALASLGGRWSLEPVSAVLEQLTHNREPEVRGRAAYVLGFLSAGDLSSACVERIEQLVGDTDEAVQASALAALERLASLVRVSPGTTACLIDLARSKRGTPRNLAIGTLARLAAYDPSGDASAVIAELIRVGDGELAAGVVSAIGRIGTGYTHPQMISRLADLARSDDAHVRRAAIAALGSLGQEAMSEGLEVAIGLLSSADVTSRGYGVWLVQRCGSAAATPSVVQLLLTYAREHPDKPVLFSVIHALERVGSVECADDVVGWLDSLTGSAEQLIRVAAISALRSLQLTGVPALQRRQRLN